MSIDSTPSPEEILKRLGPVIQEQVFVDDQTFVIARPEYSDRLLDNPAVMTAFEADEYMPYWADLWPAARMLAKVILRENWIPGTEALEVGCGLGLPGVVALARGLKVTFSDYDACALHSPLIMPASTAMQNYRTPATRLAKSAGYLTDAGHFGVPI